MRAYRFLLLCLALVLCLHCVVAVPHQAERRQDVTSVRPSATSAPLSAAQSSQASSTMEASAKPSSSVLSQLTQVPGTTTTMTPDSTPSPAVDPKNPLPIQPKVTPAMGLTGAFLLITGLVYTLIGIKNKWIYVFGSAAYLTSLAVTVLIIYLMSPPVSNGVQGAFFVAAFFTGVIFGVLSLVFSDITEGFGCLLGGFCLSMWFLSLKSGGLIPSTTGRAIFIGCMSAGGYSLSFSHYTRTYGLIASISFSGATATMLGIDCLARAGWKEFWLYLWNLNDAIFPLNTTTYPLTKYIKAELAGVVIIAVFGAVSQLRVWKLVKEHREKSAEQELQKQQQKDREEEERGRKVEDSFQRERAQWEAAYGDPNAVKSSLRSSSIASPKGSTSIKEKEVYASDSVEMVNLKKSGVAADGTTVTVSVLKDDGIQHIDAQGNPISNSNSATFNENRKVDQQPLTKKASVRSAVSPSPQVVPLPFTVPQEEPSKSDEGDNASVSAVPESIHAAEEVRRPMSKRISDMSITRQFSGRRSRAFSESEEALVNIPRVEEDRASSVAATLDNENDYSSLRELSPPHSPIKGTHDRLADSFGTPADNFQLAPKNSAEGLALDDVDPAARARSPAAQSKDHTPTKRQSLTSSTDPKPSETTTKRSPLRDSRIRVDTLVSERSGSNDQAQPSKASSSNEAETHVGSLADGSLPAARLSKVALSYRTNEWAKHLETAEKPDLEELHATAPANVLSGDEMETPAPVSDDLAYPLAGSRRSSRRASVEGGATAAFYLNRSQSTTSQNAYVDQRAMTQSPGVMSPAMLSRSNSGAQLDSLAPLPENTLMGQRENLMRKRTSNQSFTPNSSVGNLLEQAEHEDMSLAQRRQILQHHQAPLSGLIHQTSVKKPPPSASQRWQNKGWTQQGAPAGFDSHQPQRSSSTQSQQRREELFAGWRNNMQDVTPPQNQAYLAEQQRKALINERRQKELEKQQREAAHQQRASVMDSMMRSGQMLGAHREAMRKMQANANRNAS